MSLRSSSWHLFRLFGIDVYLHWSWLIVAFIEIQARSHVYTSILWNALEFLALFFIITMHEYGHSLACRSVGGTADRIVLWPLGGVAYVDPPPTAAAMLWSIAAGPLVNVALFPVLAILSSLAPTLAAGNANLIQLLHAVYWINLGLLIFNILPVYPLDGGQILRSLLWFVLGRARSLMVASAIGFIGVAAFFVLALQAHDIWLGAIAVFILLNCWGGLRHALELWRRSKLPRHADFACPWCRSAPLAGEFWQCGGCGQAFDGFRSAAACPHCGARFDQARIRCTDCGRAHAFGEWVAPALVVR